jgi:hypothetical protein
VIRLMFKKGISVAAVVITITFLCMAVSVMAVHEWRSAVGHSVSRTWNDVIGANGTSNLGFILGSFAIPIVGALLGVANFRWRKKQSWSETFQNSVEPTVLLLIAVVVVQSATFLCLMVKGVYDDHNALVTRNAGLTRQLDAANNEINNRKQHIYFLDPAMGNLRSMLMGFDIYRHAQKGRQCVMWFSEPQDARSHLAGEVAQFSNVVSDCSTFGPFPGASNPDLEKEASDGMVPDAVVFHADRNDKAALTLFDQLSSLLPLKMSYVPLPNRKTHYSLGPNTKGDETIIWFQFGTDVKWNSETWTKKEN